jgi:hypothetical protein
LVPVRRLVYIAVAAVSLLVACGSDDKAPLALDQRVLTESELPGFKLAPNAAARWTDATKFAKDTHDQDIRTTVEQNVKQLQAGGFVAAIANSLGGVGREAEAFSATVEMGSPEGATDLLDARYEDYISPCPDVCTVDVSEFEVSGCPMRRGSNEHPSRSMRERRSRRPRSTSLTVSSFTWCTSSASRER